MGSFPRRETEIIRLAHDIAVGLAANAELFPAPPGAAERGLALIEEYYQVRDASIAKAAGAREAHGAKDKVIEALVEWSKGQINYAKSLYRKDGSKLQLIGWSARREPTITPDTLPGQVGHLVVQHEGKTSVSLSWRGPVDGGEVGAYKVQRRTPGGEWIDVGTAVTGEITVHNQEGGIEFEYRVVAVNKTGDGLASNSVRVVL